MLCAVNVLGNTIIRHIVDSGMFKKTLNPTGKHVLCSALILSPGTVDISVE